MKTNTLKFGRQAALLLGLVLLLIFFAAAKPALAETLNVQKYDAASASAKFLKVTTVSIYNGEDELTTDVPAMIVNSKTLVPVRAVTEALEAKVTWEKESGQAIVEKDENKIVLSFGSNKALVNNAEVELPTGAAAELIIYQNVSRVMVPFRFISEQLGAEVAWNNALKRVTINPPETDSENWREWAKNGLQIVVDPGHGGTDPGAQASSADEKNINLTVATLTQEKLAAKGLTVIMTRSEDEYIGLVERAQKGTDQMATLFVSLHCNSSTSKTPSGIETYYYINTDSEYDEALATAIQEEVISATGSASRGVKSANFSVLRNSVIPAALIEMGFLSNAEDAALLNDPAYQDKLSIGITRGIIKFLQAYELL